MRRALQSLAVLAAAWLASGCTPGRFLAQRIAQAPNSYPRWFAPEARVVIGYEEKAIAQFPLRGVDVPGPPARIAYRVVPPAFYRFQVRATHWVQHGRPMARFDFDAAIPAPAADRPPRGTVFLLHGYALDHETMAPWAFWLGERGWTTVLVDLRGHGRSGGKRVGFGPLEAHDLDRLLETLRARGEATGPVVAFGDSYGASIALRWAASNPSLDSAVAIAPYAELVPAIERLGRDYAPWIPHRLVTAGARALPSVLHQPAAELDTVTPLRRHAPAALLVAGGDDVITPWPEVERLQSLCAPGSRLHVVLGANHESLPFRFPEIAQAVDRWLRERDARGAASGAAR